MLEHRDCELGVQASVHLTQCVHSYYWDFAVLHAANVFRSPMVASFHGYMHAHKHTHTHTHKHTCKHAHARVHDGTRM